MATKLKLIHVRVDCEFTEIVKVSKSQLSLEEETERVYQKLLQNRLDGRNFRIKLIFEGGRYCTANCDNLKWDFEHNENEKAI